MDLSIICVNWNSLQYLRSCIASVYEHTRGISLEIVVVDNASVEEDAETLTELFPEVIIIKSADNLGFARANNLGFTHSTGEYILLLNPDTKLLGPAINVLLDNARRLRDGGIIGGKLFNEDLTIQSAAIQKFPTILNQLFTSEFLRLRWPSCPLWNIAPLFVKNSRPVKVDVIPGACMLLKRECFENAGMFSIDFFMYAEDLDLNWKVKNLGLSNYYIEDAEILHFGGKSSSRQKVSHWSTTMKYRAMLRYFYKNYGLVYGSIYRASTAAVAASRLIILVTMFPFMDREVFRVASSKWGTVLKWAVGMSDLAPR